MIMECVTCNSNLPKQVLNTVIITKSLLCVVTRLLDSIRSGPTPPVPTSKKGVLFIVYYCIAATHKTLEVVKDKPRSASELPTPVPTIKGKCLSQKCNYAHTHHS